MPNDLTAPLPGLAPTGNVNRLIESFQVDVYGFGDVALDRLPNAEERQILQARYVELGYSLRPMSYTTTDKEKAAKALALMFSGIPSMRNADASDTVAAFITHLDHLPAGAVVRACEDISRNRVTDLDPDFPPTSMRVAQEATRIMTPLAAERNKIETLLHARKLIRAPVTPEQSARVSALFDDLRAKLTADREARHKEAVATVAKADTAWRRRKILEHYAALGVEPVYSKGEPISPTLLEAVGKLKGISDGSAVKRQAKRRQSPA